MKNDLIDLLACPACQTSPLEIQVRSRRAEEITEADLTCSRCGRSYPVKDGIPVMLTNLDEQPSSQVDNQKGGKDIDQKPNKMHKEVREANIAYYDAVAEVYEDEVEQAIHQSDSNQKRVDEIIKGLSEKTQKGLFLDLGCGTGNVLKLGNKHFKRAIGVDISFNMLKGARQNNLEVIQADTLSLPFKSSLFNTVSIFSVLHHLYDYLQIFKQINRVLKSDGYLYSDWDPTKQPVIDERKISWWIYRIYRRLYRYLPPPLKLTEQTTEFDTRGGDIQKAPIDFLKMRPDLKEIRVKAEFHEQKKGAERGIDVDKLKGSLMKNGFSNIQPTFHWHGKSINQLSLPLRRRFSFLKFQDYPVERFMENIMIVAQKK
ncbi:MAG: methyltransferase domain-containing protein [candidate division Zixibacteria bacterium]|nr:methyltransferase domain-containing protein [candidate division Zixibacteria bacterium]